MRYFSESKALTLELFAKEFEHYESRENFLYYWKQKQENNLNEGIITEKTSKNHTTNYNRVVDYLGGQEVLPFDVITVEWVKKFKRWMREKRKPVLSHNSAATAHTRIRTYILAAMADGYHFIFLN